jgi:hypothetical protein
LAIASSPCSFFRFVMITRALHHREEGEGGGGEGKLAF